MRTRCAYIMDNDMTETTRWLRPTGKGSDYFGPCDRCGKGGGDFWALMVATVIGGKRISPNPVAYGHAQCLDGQTNA